MVFDEYQGPLEQIKEILIAQKIVINFINYYLDHRNKTVTYKLRLQSRMDIPWGHLVHEMREVHHIREITWEEGTVV